MPSPITLKSMSDILPIIELGHPVLRQKASKIKDVLDPEVLSLANTLIRTLKKATGVGLAAPQVEISKRIFIVDPGPEFKEDPLFNTGPLVVINPTIKKRSNKRDDDWEGCLSIPGIRTLVPRYQHITVDFTTISNIKTSIDCDGFLARIFQHETDHLDGVVIFDRMKDASQIMTDAEYFRQLEEYHKMHGQ